MAVGDAAGVFVFFGEDEGVSIFVGGEEGVLVFVKGDLGVLVIVGGEDGVSEKFASVLVGVRNTMIVPVGSGSTRRVRVAGRIGTGVFVEVVEGTLLGVDPSQFGCVDGARISLEPVGFPSAELDLTVVVRLCPASSVNLTIYPACIFGTVVSLGSNSRT
jgi:hypothetical protein